MRVHDLLNGLPLQRQQDIIDFLRYPALDPSEVSVTSARRLRKEVEALCKQVTYYQGPSAQCLLA